MNFLSSSTVNTSELLDIISQGINLSAQLKTINYEASNVYDTHEKVNVQEKSIRSSKSHKFYYQNNQTIFNCVEKLVSYINSHCGTLFTLVPNDIDVIKYDTGDYFHRHTDFVPIKSSYVGFYSLLFCLDADCVGGETCLYIDGKKKKFNETIVRNEWLIFKNELEHEGLEIKSGHKIILKANLVHTNFSTIEYNPVFSGLVMARNQVIENFKSKKNGILPLHSLGEYVFYRKCFEHDKNIVPFQLVVTDALINCLRISEIQGLKKQGRSKSDRNATLWLNVGNTPIIQFRPSDYDMLDVHPRHLQDNYANKDFGDTLADDIPKNKDDPKIEKIISKYMNNEFDETIHPINSYLQKLVSNDKLNEISKSISVMMCLFWCAAIEHSKYDEYRISFPTTEESVVDLIHTKIEENMLKIQEQENEIFKMDRINYDDRMEKANKIITPEFVMELQKQFSAAQTINYQVGGSYFCNENDYKEYRCDTNFGFINLE